MQTINIRLGYWALRYVKQQFLSQYMEFFIDWTQLLYEIAFVWREHILQVWFNTTLLFSVNVRLDPSYLNAVYGMVSLTVMVLEEGSIIHMKMMNQWKSCQEPMYENIFFQRRGSASVYWAVPQKCKRSWIWNKLVTRRKTVPSCKDVNLCGSTLGFPGCFKWGSKMWDEQKMNCSDLRWDWGELEIRY